MEYLKKQFTKTVIGLLLGFVFFIGLLLFVGIFAFLDSPNDGLALLFGVILLLVVVVIMMIASIIVNYCKYSSIVNSLKDYYGYNIEKFNRECQRGPKFKNLIITTDFIVYNMSEIIPIADIIWVYKDYNKSLCIYTRDQKKHNIMVAIKPGSKREQGTNYVLRLIARRQEGISLSYDENFEKLYKDNFQMFLHYTSVIRTVDSNYLENQYIQQNLYQADFS